MEKKIYKSEKNKVLTGTCGGIGEYFNIDPTIVRLIFVVALVFGGSSIIIYIIAALVIPNSPVDRFDNMHNYDEYKTNQKFSKKEKAEDAEFNSYFEK